VDVARLTRRHSSKQATCAHKGGEWSFGILTGFLANRDRDPRFRDMNQSTPSPARRASRGEGVDSRRRACPVEIHQDRPPAHRRPRPRRIIASRAIKARLGTARVGRDGPRWSPVSLRREPAHSPPRPARQKTRANHDRVQRPVAGYDHAPSGARLWKARRAELAVGERYQARPGSRRRPQHDLATEGLKRLNGRLLAATLPANV